MTKIGVNVARFLLAGTFVFSGFVKANDPYGMVYKLQDYLAAFGIGGVPEMLVLVAAVALAFTEFMLGVYLLFGISRRAVARLVTLFMGFMTLLTVYIFIFDPVKDCGCFGDAVVISNGATLAKNIVLMVAALALLKWHRLEVKFLSENSEWLMSLFAMLYIVAFSVYSIVALPVFDFRPYHVGADVRQGANLPDSLRPVYEVKLIYECDGRTLELDLDDDDPDSSWTYVETRSELVKEGAKADLSEFRITDYLSDYDVTDELLADEGYNFLLVVPRLETADESRVDLINEVYDYAVANGYGFYCVTASDTAAQSYWTDHTGAEYNYYFGDERMLKTVVRSNPGLVLMKDGKIVRKWSCFMFPDEYELSGSLEEISVGRAEVVQVQKKVTNVLMFFLIPLIVLTVLDRIAMRWVFYRAMKRKSKELKLESIEKKLGIEEIEKNINNKFNSKKKEK